MKKRRRVEHHVQGLRSAIAKFEAETAREGACCFENEASTALRQTRSCSRDWTSREARARAKKKAGPISHNILLALIGKVVPCRKWGGWRGAGGDFEKGVYGLAQLSSQQPAASAQRSLSTI
jgi:hypothetical protein